MKTVSGSFYDDFAWLYNDIANDRDFIAEIQQLGLTQLPHGATVVELFAGPAYHCRELEIARPDLNIIAIDNSEAMHKIAVQNGFKGTYLVKDALEAVETLSEIHFVLVARYSLVLIALNKVQHLFERVAKALSGDGLFIVEIHPDAMSNPELYMAGNWEALDIYERTVETQIGSATCRWPATVETLNSDPLVLKMGVEIDIQSQEPDQNQSLYFESTENIHSYNDLMSISQKTGLVLRGGRTSKHKESSFIAWSALGKKNDLLSALTGPFELTNRNRLHQNIDKSKLNLPDHDRVLSSHVYNLL